MLEKRGGRSLPREVLTDEAAQRWHAHEGARKPAPRPMPLADWWDCTMRSSEGIRAGNLAAGVCLPEEQDLRGP